jgi:putative DNA primase/helicase
MSDPSDFGFDDDGDYDNDELDAEALRQDALRAPQFLPPPSKPMDVARVFIDKACLANGLLTLHHWRGGWWLWRTSHWIEAEDRAVRALLYWFTEKALYTTDRGEMKAWAPTKRKIGDLSEALAAICILSADRDQPSWLDDRTTSVVVSVANGLLDVEERRLLPHTPQFFNQTSVPFAYEADAPEPTLWLKFLKELWLNELEPVLVLGEWFGLVISGRTDLQKIFLMVGPTRGGKGAIARILTALVGRKNVAGPTLSSLSGEFGLMPLIGKPLAIISDARLGGKDTSIVIERLLSISGEDTLTVNRKYKDHWTGKLPCRLHIISNELPKLGDASTAIIGRIVLLLTTRSWLGKEDHDLEPALHGELPGILNWSLDGLARLTKNGGRFTLLPSADEAIIAMRDLASPVAAFVRERCRIDAATEVLVDELYAAYCSWAADNGHTKPTKQNFGRFLRAAVPSVRIQRPREGETRPRVYSGIDLVREPDAEAHVCTQCGKADGREERCFIGGEEAWLHPECQRVYAAELRRYD